MKRDIGKLPHDLDKKNSAAASIRWKQKRIQTTKTNRMTPWQPALATAGVEGT
jgi:hypothetical protein